MFERPFIKYWIKGETDKNKIYNTLDNLHKRETTEDLFNSLRLKKTNMDKIYDNIEKHSSHFPPKFMSRYDGYIVSIKIRDYLKQRLHNNKGDFLYSSEGIISSENFERLSNKSIIVAYRPAEFHHTTHHVNINIIYLDSIYTIILENSIMCQKNKEINI